MSLGLPDVLIRPVVPAPYPPCRIVVVQAWGFACSLNTLLPVRAARPAITSNTIAARFKLVFIFFSYLQESVQTLFASALLHETPGSGLVTFRGTKLPR